MTRPKIKRIKNHLPLIVLPLILIAALFVWVRFSESNITVIDSQNGVWDLTDIDLNGTKISLAGYVEHIPNALLTPAEFTARQSEAIIATPPEQGYFTSRLRLYADGVRWHTLGHLVLDRAVRVYANGVHILDAGAVGTAPEAVTNISSRILFTALPDAESGIIEIIVQSASFVNAVIRTDTIGWYVGGGYLQATFRLVDQIQIAIMVSFLLLSAMAFLLFVNTRTKISSHYISLLFALYCFTWFLGAGVTGARPLGDWLPWLGWEVMHRLSFIIVHVTMGLLVAIINALFPGVMHKYFRVGAYIIAAAFTIAAFFIDVNLLRAAAGGDSPAPFIYLAGIAYVFIRFAVKLRTLNRAQYIFLCGIVLFQYITIRDILWHLGDFLLPPFGGYGLMVFHEFMILTAAIAALLMTLCASFAVFITVRDEALAARENEQRLSMQVEAANRVEHLRSEMMRTLSHEMHTPLSVMMGFAQLSAEEARELGLDDSMVQSLDTIAAKAKDMANMVEEMRQLVLIPEYAKNRHPIDISTAINKVSGLFEKILAAGGRRLTVSLPYSLPPVLGSDAELTSVIFNLLRNADLHGEYGDVSVTARHTGTDIQVTVSDNGKGIDAELLPKVFERGISGSVGGSGYGLAICKDIFNAYGGEITIQSEPGKGCAVTFTLPVHINDTEDEGGNGHEHGTQQPHDIGG